MIQTLKEPYRKRIVNARRLKLYYDPNLKFFEADESSLKSISHLRTIQNEDFTQLLDHKYQLPDENSFSRKKQFLIPPNFGTKHNNNPNHNRQNIENSSNITLTDNSSLSINLIDPFGDHNN